MGKRSGSLLAEAVVAMFTALVVLIAASSMLSSAVKLAESGKRRLEAERRAGEVIALLVAGGADELSSFETERRVIPGGVSVRIYSIPVGNNGSVAVVWPEHGR